MRTAKDLCKHVFGGNYEDGLTLRLLESWQREIHDAAIEKAAVFVSNSGMFGDRVVADRLRALKSRPEKIEEVPDAKQ